MAKDIKQAITRSRDTLLADAVGAVSLVVMLVTALHLPSFF